MNISNEKMVMVFKREYQDRVFYSVGLSKKDRNGNYENGYMPVQFKKGVDLENQTNIYIKSAWLSFYLKDKATVPYIFINEFETVQETINKAKQEVKEESDPFKEFGEEIENMELPF